MFWYLLVTYAVVLEFVGLFLWTKWLFTQTTKMQKKMLEDLDIDDFLEETSTPDPL
jgi:hypothetical protein